jgi:hypothetical protein
MATFEKAMKAFEYRQKLIGIRWLAYEKLRTLSTTHVIDHMLDCEYRAAEALNRKPYRDEKRDDHTAMWAAYRNQVMWCMQILVERNIYQADPYRDDRSEEYLSIDGS